MANSYERAWAAWSLKRAKDGDLSLILERLRDPETELSPDERRFLADLVEHGRGRREGRPLDRWLPFRQRQATSFVFILRKQFRVPASDAVARVARLFDVSPGTIREWRRLDEARAPERWARYKADPGALWRFWRPSIENNEQIRQALEVPEID